VSERRAASIQFVLLFAAAVAYRLYLAPRFYGWEEGDYGNVMMVREVMDSRFTWFRTGHMPGWYSLAALPRLLVDRPRGTALAVTMAFSALNVGLVALLSRKLVSTSAAWLVGLWLVFQPEMALYGASTLRSPVFASIATLGLAALLVGRRDAGFGFVAMAFLTRMEGFFTLFAPALWAWWKDQGRGLRGLLVPLAILGGVSIGWQLYVTVGHGERQLFVWGPLSINFASLGDNDFDLGQRLTDGVKTSWWLLTWTLPRKIGWAWWLLMAGGAFALAAGSTRPGGRTVLAFAGFGLVFWLAEGFLTHHEPNHNLYWTWLLNTLPFLALVAAAGWGWLERRLPPGSIRAVAWGAVALSAVPFFASETTYQMDRAERWYRPQLEMSTWLEEETPPGTGVLVGSIPEVWLKRAPSDLRIYSWWTLPEAVRPGSPRPPVPPAEFAQFLADEEIDYVVWFSEEWTDSAKIAPWMMTGQNMTVGPIGLTAIAVDPLPPEGYGWILYLVTQQGRPQPKVPPPFGHGFVGAGWEGVR